MTTHFEQAFERLEADIFKGQFHSGALERLYQLKTQLHELRNAVTPIVDIALQLTRLHADLIPKEINPYFCDVHDHVAHIITTLAGLQEVLTTAMQVNLRHRQLHHFQPKRAGNDARRVLLKEVRVKNDPTRKRSLPQGLVVLTPALAIDDVGETLVYLEMVGAKQWVKANWAALVGGGKVHWLGRKRVRLDGMKEYLEIQATLPCGWSNHILIHKQASLKEMNPEQPFYLLDEGRQPIPPVFYPMLNKTLALPLLCCPTGRTIFIRTAGTAA